MQSGFDGFSFYFKSDVFVVHITYRVALKKVSGIQITVVLCNKCLLINQTCIHLINNYQFEIEVPFSDSRHRSLVPEFI